jgi:hypothetical protein
MTPKELRKIGKKFGREGIVKRAREIMENAINSGSCMEVIDAVGRIKVLFDMSGYDVHWKEKASIGVDRETSFIVNNEENESYTSD